MMSIDRKELISKLHQLPSLPIVLQELIASLSQSDLNTTSLVLKIEHDQGLSAKVLRMANSPFYGLPREVGSISDAVTILGFDTIRSLVLSMGMMKEFPASPGSLFDRKVYWQRCYRVAAIAKALSKNIPEGQPLAFIAGQFCEIGQIVLDICIPQVFSELIMQQAKSDLSLIEIERSELGFDHYEIGAEIIRLWNFPVEIEQLVRHWSTPELLDASDSLPCLVHTADLIESGFIGEELMSKITTTWCSQLQLTWEQIESNLPAFEKLVIDDLIHHHN
jgi:HD-like signal output (HDOD) protein